MALLSISNLAKYFGPDEIFSQVSFEVHAGDCVALVGVNGCGKSTLLDIIAGAQEPDAGTVSRARDIRIGYMPQIPDFKSEGTLWEAMKAVFADLQAQQETLHRLEEQMASSDVAEREMAMARYGVLLEKFERAGGFTYEARIGQVLGGLGFRKDEFDMPVAYLSGGEKTRALLARLLLEEPDLLLLDEPTNHLDLEGIEWLEEQLKGWKGGIIVVAHDREFLDTIANRVIEMEFGRIETYRGNYTAYVQQRADRRRQQQIAYETQQQEIAKTEDYIRRYMAGQRTAQAKGRLRRLERVERLERPIEQQHIHINLQTTLRSGDLVLGLYNLQVGYTPEAPLVTVEEAEIRRRQRVALVGPNGSGKTTLLRTILRELKPLHGRMRIGSAVHIGYFAQVQEHLIAGKNVLDTLLDAGMASVAETRSFLARYGFRGDDVFKDVGVLSGGERARVALAILALEKANFLLLDEPTNHLDIPSQEVLQEVITDFNGTVLLVSHDRYLIREVATQVWAIADGKLHVFAEGYPAYAAWHQEYRSGGSSSMQRREEEARARREAERQIERERERALARQRKQLDALETQIHTLETRLRELTAALDLAGRAQDVARVAKLGTEYHHVEADLNHLLEEWASVAELKE
ncbi:MAG TPA: ABC-F family ATP-binding cassette domain-containing protein [Anaerolineae bacterium]|nr:ABC-F family ATP-binding cassette domain-containing protein [Anaerolineae bacterium]HQK15445.1 ABC-F family ATP-binding cassette domain-containing protein [Anaerolineae bacterium]